MMKGMFKRALAGVAAAALAVTGLALGVGAANAAESPVTGSTQFTFTAETAEQLQNRTVVAYKIGDYVRYGEEPNAVYGVQTATAITDTSVIEDALKEAGINTDTVNPQPSDWLAWAVQGTLDKSESRPWDTLSVTRKVADYLADNLTKLGEATPVTLGEAKPVQDGEGDGKYQATASLTEPGIYLFIDNSTETDSITKAVPMIVYSGEVDANKNLTDIFNGKTVNFKNTKNGEKSKEADKTTVSVGDTITYTLKGTVSNPVPASFQFVDQPGVGLTILNDDEHPITLTAGVIPLILDTDYTIDFNKLDVTTKPGELRGSDTASFTVTLTPAGLEKSKGEEVVMTYTAKVNEQALGKDTVVNKIVENDGTAQSVPVSLFDFSFKKLDANGTGLKGAEFTISGESLPADYAPKTVKSDQDGNVTFQGLAAGKTYTVTETKVPNDFMQLNLTFTVTIDEKTGAATFTTDKWGLVDTENKTVTNVRNITQLPLTGAAGTMLFSVLGLLIAGAGALVYMKSRNVKRALRG